MSENVYLKLIEDNQDKLNKSDIAVLKGLAVGLTTTEIASSLKNTRKFVNNKISQMRAKGIKLPLTKHGEKILAGKKATQSKSEEVKTKRVYKRKMQPEKTDLKNTDVEKPIVFKQIKSSGKYILLITEDRELVLSALRGEL